MQSTAHLNEHPIHPMLIPYPFALLTSATAFDVAARVTRRESLARTADHLTAAGLGTALVAAVPGIVDYFGTVPRHGASAQRSATQHALFNLSALACFALSRNRVNGRRGPSDGGLALSLIGTALLSIGGWLGGQLVYHEHVGVVESGRRLPSGAGPANDRLPAAT